MPLLWTWSIIDYIWGREGSARVSALWVKGLPWTLECLPLFFFCFLFLWAARVSVDPPTEHAHSEFKGVWDFFGLPELNVYVLCVYFMLL